MIDLCQLADGGEGTVDAIVYAQNGEKVTVSVSDPLGRSIMAEYGICGRTAVIEMSAAAGITLVDGADKDPLRTTTYGVGQLIRDAIEKGCRDFIIGIGGSATNDGGTGMLSALGYRFLDKNGKEIALCGAGLEHIESVDGSGAMRELKECSFTVACDVKNPLCGENGCSRIFAPQKGATPKTVEDMDKWLGKYAEITKAYNPEADMNAHGAGAAGGMGFAFMAYLSGKLRSGIEIIIKETMLEEKIRCADVVVTGEGKLDGQSVMGKAPVGVATCAKKYSKPVIAFAGAVTDDAGVLNGCGIDAFFSITPKPCSLEDAMDIEKASENLTSTCEQAFRTIKIFSGG